MWQDDTITLQTPSENDTNGCIKNTWSTLITVLCDVQPINKEKVLKEYGFTDSNEFKEVFDYTMNANWTEEYQCSFESKQYLIKKVDILNKMGLSNHTHVILARV